jgi:hypothetical protein
LSAGETRARLRREDDDEEAAFAAAFLDPFRLVRLASDTWWHPVVPSGDARAIPQIEPAGVTPSRPSAAGRGPSLRTVEEIERDRLTAEPAEEEEGA